MKASPFAARPRLRTRSRPSDQLRAIKLIPFMAETERRLDVLAETPLAWGSGSAPEQVRGVTVA